MTRRIYGWTVKGSSIVVGDQPLTDLARDHGTPLYVYDGDIIRRRAAEIHAAFPGFEVFYSVKANSNPDVCSMLAELGFGADASSPNEIALALAAGYDPSRIGYVGPAKSPRDLASAVDAGIGMFYVESATELERLSRLGADRGEQVPVALRINTRHRPSSAGELMAGVPSPFGMDEEAVRGIVGNIDRVHLDIVGIHTFVASQVVDADALALHFERVADLALDLAEDLEFDLRLINFGGGFGIPYGKAERGLDLGRLGQRVSSHLPDALANRGGSKIRLLLEVGRYIVGEAGMFLTEVVDVKQSRGTTFVVTNAGVNAFARAAMPWAQAHACSLVGKASGKRRTETCKIVGPSCMPGDVICESAELPDPRPGDIVGVHHAGAYGRSMSMLEWGSFRPPKEILADRGHVVACGSASR